jgi:putative DNA primase/helicase
MQKKGDQATNDIASLKGARFVSATETDERNRMAESVIKRLTGNDEISARFLYGEYFTFIPTFKIVMATNHKPRISGTDHAIWRRIRLIPFTRSFPEEKLDKRLPEKLEAERTGILRWMVEGCLRWQKEGLGNAELISEATDEYKHEMSDIQMFLADCCVVDEMSLIRSSFLYGHYVAWCETNKERPRSNRNFSIKLSESGMDKVRRSDGAYWIGIKVKDEEGESP